MVQQAEYLFQRGLDLGIEANVVSVTLFYSTELIHLACGKRDYVAAVKQVGLVLYLLY